MNNQSLKNTLLLFVTFRIERLWRDVRNKVIQFYIDLFKSFEKVGMKIDDVWHIFTLQYLFMPRIQDDLNEFKEIWNNHALSTESNRTPLQLLIIRRDSIAPDDNVDEEYGVDNDEEEDEDDLAEHYRVPCDPVIYPLTSDNLVLFKARLAPVTMATPINDLANWYYTGLEFALQIKHTQQ